MQLNWEDTKDIIIDSTIIFGNGYDFFGVDSFRQEADTPIGRFMVWPNKKGEYALYGGKKRWCQAGFKTIEDAKNQVEKFVNIIIGDGI